MLVGSAKRIFTKGPAGPAGATLASALTDVTVAVRAVLTAADLSSARAAFGLAIGTSVQAWSATLDALSGVTTTAFGRSLLTQADAPTALGTIAAGGVPNAFLAQVPAYTLKANLLASAANPADVGLSAIIDAVFGNTRGALLARSASGWSLLAPGTAGQFLGTGGSGADPSWGTPSGAGNVSTANSPAAGQIATFASGTSIQGFVLPVGQCRLVYSSSTALLLKPYQGNQLWVNGAYRTIPSAGASLANTGLTAGTLYYVYVYMNGSTLTLEAVTTGHATDATYGHEVKSGDSTRTLVGMVYIGSGTPGTFVDAPATRYVASWFNRVPRRLYVAPTAGTSTATTSPGTEPSAANRVAFVAWADAGVAAHLSGNMNNSGSGANNITQLTLDGNLIGDPFNQYIQTGNQAYTTPYAAETDVTEGLHYIGYKGYVSAGTGTWGSGVGGTVLQ